MLLFLFCTKCAVALKDRFTICLQSQIAFASWDLCLHLQPYNYLNRHLQFLVLFKLIYSSVSISAIAMVFGGGDCRTTLPSYRWR